MERDYLGRKNQCCENDYTTKCSLQVRCYPYQITNEIFHRTRTKNFTVYMETQKTLNRQSSLEKEECSWRIQPCWFQNMLQSYTHQGSTILAQKQKCRPIWSKIESPEIHPRIYGYFIFGKEGTYIQWSKDGLFNKWCLENCTAKSKIMKLEHFIKSYTKINLKWIKDLNARPETVKL